MNFTITQQAFYTVLSMVYSAVESRSTLPVLSNVLLSVSGETLTVTATDLEVEQISQMNLIDSQLDASITVPARKLIDIVKAMPKDKNISFSVDGDDAQIKCGRSRYKLTTISASDFPDIDTHFKPLHSLTIDASVLCTLLNDATFSMANQDVRYYLNGALINITPDYIGVISTDGHRISSAKHTIKTNAESPIASILPRKGVLTILKLLQSFSGEITIGVTTNHFRITFGENIFTSKLVDGRYPDYNRVIPKDEKDDIRVEVNTSLLQSMLSRVSILANEKTKGVRLAFDNNSLCLMANNPEQERSEEVIDVEYPAQAFEIGVNASYLLDVLNHTKTENVVLVFKDSNSTIRLFPTDETALHCVMPMRL